MSSLKLSCPYCCDDTQNNSVEEKKTKISRKDVTFPFVRIIHSGEGWRDARIIPFDEKNVLKDVSEFADLERFEPRLLFPV